MLGRRTLRPEQGRKVFGWVSNSLVRTRRHISWYLNPIFSPPRLFTLVHVHLIPQPRSPSFFPLRQPLFPPPPPPLPGSLLSLQIKYLSNQNPQPLDVDPLLNCLLLNGNQPFPHPRLHAGLPPDSLPPSHRSTICSRRTRNFRQRMARR